jgi:hypothetical protein
MSTIDKALDELESTGKPDALYAAVRTLPRPSGKAQGTLGDDYDVDPVNPEWDKVYAAYCRGAVPEDVYAKAAGLVTSGVPEA